MDWLSFFGGVLVCESIALVSFAAYLICKNQPDEVSAMKEQLVINKLLENKFEEYQAYKMGENFSLITRKEMDKNENLLHCIRNFGPQNEYWKKWSITHTINILSKAYNVKAPKCEINFKRDMSTWYKGKNTIEFNIWQNEFPADTIGHEFAHVLQDSGKSPQDFNYMNLAKKNYQNAKPKKTKELTNIAGKIYEINLKEKEARAVGRAFARYLGV